jgi:hypothetical protein
MKYATHHHYNNAPAQIAVFIQETVAKHSISVLERTLQTMISLQIQLAVIQYTFQSGKGDEKRTLLLMTIILKAISESSL